MNAFYVNDTYYDAATVGAMEASLARLPHFARCAGQRYTVCLSDPAEWVAVMLYLRQAGASIVPLHPTTPRAAALRTARSTGSRWLLSGSALGAEEVEARVADAEPVVVHFSSGTTGEPNPVERPWRSIEREVEAYVERIAESSTPTPVIACPITHAYGFVSGLLAAFRMGVVPVVLTNANPKYVVKRARSVDNAILYASPPLLNLLVRLLGNEPVLNAVMSSGAALGAGCLARLKQCCRRVFQQYGCSEVGCISVNLDTIATGEVGSPLRHLRVSCGSSAVAPEEIIVHSVEHRVATRDLGYWNERGICFVERLDDTINVAGVNVYPGDVESVVLDFPDVTDAVAYKKADGCAGERVCLQFTAPEEIDVEQLRRWCADRLSPFQLPLEMKQVDEIGRLSNGKVNRRALASGGAELQPVVRGAS